MMAKETHSLIQSILTMQEEITILCKGFLRTLKKKKYWVKISNKIS